MTKEHIVVGSTWQSKTILLMTRKQKREREEEGVVVHVYNPSYVGSRDWEDCSLRIASKTPSQISCL
jgi:hypothetical protein